MAHLYRLTCACDLINEWKTTMKVSLLTAATLIIVFGLTGCTGPSSSTSPRPAGPAAVPDSAPPSGTAEAQPGASAAVQTTAPPAAQAPAPIADPEGDKVPVTDDSASTTNAADSAEIIEAAKQWHSAEKEALFHEKMDGSGLSSHVPIEQGDTFYRQAAAACQRRFDGQTPALQGVWLEIENLALSVYCPEVE